MRTQAADPDAAVPGTSGAIKCIARHLPAVTTEYAALWVPLRPPPSPAMPPYDNSTLVPYVATILEVEDNPVFQAVVAILVINLLTILYAMRLRITHPNGLLRPRAVFERKRKSKPDTGPAALKGAAPGALTDNGTPLALTGPPVAVDMPKLSVKFDIEGQLGSFDDAAFVRRLATLIGVDDTNIAATLSAGSRSETISIDTEISCTDPITLVMAAKTLKKGITPLGLALGVRLVESPLVKVPEVSTAKDNDGKSAGEKSPADRQKPERVAEKLAPTIQERIPALGMRAGLSSRRLLANVQSSMSAGGDFTAAFAAPAPNAGALQMGRSTLSSTSVGAVPRPAPAPVPLEGGIQERITFAGMSRAARGATALRLRASASSNRVDPLAPSGGPASGVLGGLNLSASDLQEPTLPGAPKEGIQERLPAIPGMRRQGSRRTGAPATRMPSDTLVAGTNPAPGLSAPIQERLPRMPRPPVANRALVPSPPPSPPSKVKPVASSAGSVTSMVVKRESIATGAAHGMRLQANAKVMPSKEKAAQGLDEDVIPETWDDRPIKEIVWGIAREHTLVGFVAAFLYGDGPKLATIVQATQLFWGCLLGLLFLSCVQIRYVWLAAKWQGDGITEVTALYDIHTNEMLYDHASVVAGIGMAAALVGWPCVIVARWLFLLVNRTRAEKVTKSQWRLTIGSAWSVVLLTVAAISIAAINIAVNMDANIVKNDIMVSWVIAILVDWLVVEPMMLSAFALLVMLLKWCTSFDDLPEMQGDLQSFKQQTMLLEEKKTSEPGQVLRLTSSKGV